MRIRLSLLVATLLVLTGCPEDGAPGIDADGDGSPDHLDCDDADPLVHPDAVEIVDDGVDQDCNGADTVTCFYDGDGDGFGWPGTILEPDGDCTDDDYDSDNADDCDDGSDTIYPGAPEVPDNGFDDDCSGADTVTCWTDADGDGFGGDEPQLDPDGNCTDAGQAAFDDDCDDSDPASHPGAEDVGGDGIDQDCNGVDAALCYYDGDGDGFGWPGSHTDTDGVCDGENQSPEGTDCDDSEPTIYPGAEEIPDDGFDQDCNGADLITCWEDLDGDAWGSDVAVDVDPDGSCTDALQAPLGGDCDDANDTIHPEAEDAPDDGVDQDCNGADATTCYYDGDGDGFGWPGTLVGLDGDCDDPFESYVGTDCDDGAATIYPGAAEVADDGFDQDCNGSDAITCFIDGDGDGFGGSSTTVDPLGECAAVGLSTIGGDCDDTTATTSPLAYDAPDDGVDQDCSGVDAAECYYDGDNDGFGWSGTFVDEDGDCTDDPYESTVGTDCDDSLDTVYPGAPEVVGDGIDQNCDGVFE